MYVSGQLALFLILTIVMIVTAEWGNFAFAPSNLFEAIDESQKPKPVTLMLTDLYAVGKGGSLFVGQYNEYHYLGNDTKGLQFHIINSDDYKYHIAAVGQNMTFTCYADFVHCK